MDGAEVRFVRTEDLPRAPSGKIIHYRDLTNTAAHGGADQ